ncbi:unnamed protein product [Moneuplotes crassus]|uniref:Uncharacterized protein n=1 Tax=Euplotes crassus TaxID=5936 RepID=A0AAD1UN46_EUPCR|nr:unnamed protein product [Moneuplotes crassus]
MVNKTQRDYIKLVDEKESKLGIKINARLRSTESRLTRKQSFKADRLKIKIPIQFRERNLSAESRRKRLGATLQGKSLLLTNSQSSSPDARMMTSQVFSGACLKSRNINGNPNLTTPSSKLALSQKILIDEMSEPYLGGHEEVGNKRRARRVMNEVSNDMFKTYTHSDPMYKNMLHQSSSLLRGEYDSGPLKGKKLYEKSIKDALISKKICLPEKFSKTTIPDFTDIRCINERYKTQKGFKNKTKRIRGANTKYWEVRVTKKSPKKKTISKEIIDFYYST